MNQCCEDLFACIWKFISHCCGLYNVSFADQMGTATLVWVGSVAVPMEKGVYLHLGSVIQQLIATIRAMNQRTAVSD